MLAICLAYSVLFEMALSMDSSNDKPTDDEIKNGVSYDTWISDPQKYQNVGLNEPLSNQNLPSNYDRKTNKLGPKPERPKKAGDDDDAKESGSAGTNQISDALNQYQNQATTDTQPKPNISYDNKPVDTKADTGKVDKPGDDDDDMNNDNLDDALNDIERSVSYYTGRWARSGDGPKGTEGTMSAADFFVAALPDPEGTMLGASNPTGRSARTARTAASCEGKASGIPGMTCKALKNILGEAYCDMNYFISPKGPCACMCEESGNYGLSELQTATADSPSFPPTSDSPVEVDYVQTAEPIPAKDSRTVLDRLADRLARLLNDDLEF